MKAIEFIDITKGKTILDVNLIDKIYEIKIEDNYNATAIQTEEFVYMTHEAFSSVLGKYEGSFRYK
jgi:hypothetical protein